MVSGLQFFERDPMYPDKNRGRGWYYYRGRLTTGLVGGAGVRNPRNQRGAYWSFYSRNQTEGSRMDARKAAVPTKAKSPERRAALLKYQPHKADYKTRNTSSGGVKAMKHTRYPRGSRQNRQEPEKRVKNRKTTRAGEGITGFF